jgi:hypothetical protein
MVSVYARRLQAGYKRVGRPNTLSVEDRVLMMLEYNREYRTYFHIGQSYGVSESRAYKCIKQVEDLLIQSGEFSLPKRTSLLGAEVEYEVEYEVVLLDATETKVARPKKTAGVL